jgi:hypothetical chaperone protein
MNVEQEVLQVLDEVLSLGGRSASFSRDTHLLGAIPELDSMAVVSLITTLEERLGHALAAAAEQAKIDVAQHGTAQIDLWLLERGLKATLQEDQAASAIEADLERIVEAARETGRQAGLAPGDVDVVYFTGGSTGLTPLVDRIAACFPAAQRVRGDRFASVAQGLGWHARAVFGARR